MNTQLNAVSAGQLKFKEIVKPMKKWTSDFYEDKQEDRSLNKNAVDQQSQESLDLDMDQATYERKKFEVWKILEAHLKEQIKQELQNVQEKIDRLNN